MEEIYSFYKTNETLLNYAAILVVLLVWARQYFEWIIQRKRAKRTAVKITALSYNAEKLGFKHSSPPIRRSGLIYDLYMHRETEIGNIMLSAYSGRNFIAHIEFFNTPYGPNKTRIKGISTQDIRSSIYEAIDNIVFSGHLKQENVPEFLTRPPLHDGLNVKASSAL